MLNELLLRDKTRIAMAANLPYPINSQIIRRKLYDCCGFNRYYMFPRHINKYNYAKAIIEIENGINIPYWFPQSGNKTDLK